MTAVRKHEDVQQYFNLDSPSQGTTLWRKLDADNSQHVDIDEFSEYVGERERERGGARSCGRCCVMYVIRSVGQVV
jgi:hypothetical protein